MSYISMKSLLEAGVHFGHRTNRWNPKMSKYVFGARNGIYILDLQKTVQCFNNAFEFTRDMAKQGCNFLFVGTKKQAQDAINEGRQSREDELVGEVREAAAEEDVADDEIVSMAEAELDDIPEDEVK